MANDPAITLDELLEIDRNRQAFARLLEQVRGDRGVVPFVGAGLSVPCGMPGWTAFLLEEAKRTKVDVCAAIHRHLENAEFEEAAQRLADDLRPLVFRDAIEDAFGSRALEGKALRGPVCLLPKLAKGPVFTTNFDRVLEKAFEEAGRPFKERVWGAKPDMLSLGLHQDHPYLFKLHGDAAERTDRVLTLAEYEHHYGARDVVGVDLERTLPLCLKQLFTTRTLLFVGASLTADRTLQLLRRVSKEGGAPPTHFAIVEMPSSDEAAKQRRSFFADHGIRPLWFPERRFEAIEVLLEAMLMLAPPGGASSRTHHVGSGGAEEASSPGAPSITSSSGGVRHPVPAAPDADARSVGPRMTPQGIEAAHQAPSSPQRRGLPMMLGIGLTLVASAAVIFYGGVGSRLLLRDFRWGAEAPTPDISMSGEVRPAATPIVEAPYPAPSAEPSAGAQSPPQGTQRPERSSNPQGSGSAPPTSPPPAASDPDKAAASSGSQAGPTVSPTPPTVTPAVTRRPTPHPVASSHATAAAPATSPSVATQVTPAASSRPDNGCETITCESKDRN